MHYHDYEAWLHEEHSKVIMEPHCVEVGPFYGPTQEPDRAPWQMEWCVLFPDDMYFVVRENFFARKKNRGGGGYRADFSFHYGPANPKRNGLGIPIRDSNNFPPLIRIDSDKHGAHLHFGGLDHIYQEKVKKLNISDTDVFDFVRAVLDFRKPENRRAFDEVMGFEVIS